MNERKLTKSELAKREDIILNMKGNKRDLVKKYGADAEKVMYGRATNMAKKQSESMTQTNVKLKEMVKDALKNPKKADLNKDGKLSDYEKTRGKAVEKNLSEDFDEENLKPLPPRAKLDNREDFGYEEEDLDNPDEDLVIIGSGYLEGFNRPHSLNNGELEMLGKKIVKQLYKGDKNAAFKDIVDRLNEDLDLGHEDNEPHMLKADLYRIGKYAMELYNIVDGFEGEGEVDFPSWWQAKITNAKTAIVGAKHYLDFEINEPKIDAVVDTIDDITPDDDVVDTDVLDVDIDESQLGTDDDTGFTKTLYTPNEMGDVSVAGEYASGAFEESLKKTVAEKLAKKLKESISDEDKKHLDMIAYYEFGADSTSGGFDKLGDAEKEEARKFMVYANVDKTFDDKPVKEGLPKGYWDKKIDAKDEDQDGKIDEDLSGVEAGKTYANMNREERKQYGNYIDHVDIGHFVTPSSEWKDNDNDYFYKLGLRVVKQRYKGNIGAAYDYLKNNQKVDESYNTLVNKIEKSGKSKKAAKAIAGAVASYKAKGGGKGPTAKQK